MSSSDGGSISQQITQITLFVIIVPVKFFAD